MQHKPPKTTNNSKQIKNPTGPNLHANKENLDKEKGISTVMYNFLRDEVLPFLFFPKEKTRSTSVEPHSKRNHLQINLFRQGSYNGNSSFL
jgi:hypothetical protein